MLFVVVVVVLGCLAVNAVLPPRPAWMQAVEAWARRVVADRAQGPAALDREPDALAAADPGSLLDPAPDVLAERPAGSALFTTEFVQQRLDLLADELRRLDEVDHGSVFALGFRTLVAQDAYRALLDDRKRLATVPRYALGDVALDDDLVRPRGPAEVLEL